LLHVKDEDRLKEEGNSAFNISKLEDALEKYTECLEVRYAIALQLFVSLMSLLAYP